jgi:hypothetical protein
MEKSLNDEKRKRGRPSTKKEVSEPITEKPEEVITPEKPELHEEQINQQQGYYLIIACIKQLHEKIEVLEKQFNELMNKQ